MIDYTARVETDRRETTEDFDDELMDRLEGFHPALGHMGRLSITISYPAAGLRQAVTTGLAVVGDALAGTGANPTAIHVLPTAERDIQLGLDPLPELLSVTEAARVIGVSGGRVRQLLDEQKLAGVKVGATWAVPRTAAEKRATEPLRA